MVKGFVAGVLWGGVVAGAGLGVVSVMSPMKQAPAGVAEAPVAEGVAAAAPAGQGASPVAPDAGAEKPVEAVVQPQADEPLAADVPKPAAAADAPVVPDEAAAPVVAETPAEPVAEATGDAAPAQTETPSADPVPEPTPTLEPAPEASPTVSADMPSPDALKPAEDPAPPPTSETPVAELPKAGEGPVADAAEPAPVADVAPTPAPEAQPETQPEVNETLLTPAPEAADQKPATISPDPVQPVPDVVPEVAQPELVQPEGTATIAPDSGLEDKVAGVTTGRLPAIGKDAAQPAEGAEAATPADLPAYRRFARRFDNAEGKPLFAVLLVDPGTPDLDRAQLAALSFPVTFVVDPLAENASAAAAIYRAAGQEVVMLATGIPAGAKPSDLEQTFAAHAAALPEAVAVLDLAAGGFQDDRGLATDVVGLIKAQGRGVLTYDRGLNAADQVARRDDLPAALVFRSLDDDGEDAPLIRRYLDRAAFKAAQEGRVVVVGTARAETIAALLEWTVEGRASSVALAPATAVLSVE